ncbi:plasmid replication/partition related protein [Hydrogenophaga sp. 5NK40-0174]|uniref:plasmid replication/partition related protein n=1 Tax=Hydrogenophaga sp. 5NK40-0174 TaxID=3127649 RepID=UPI003109300E
MNIVVNEDLKAYIDPLTADEYDALERSILAEGCRDSLILWGDVLVDGHNRYAICQKHGLPFNTIQNSHFQSMEDVHLWMINQHLGRRSVSDYQRGVLALRKREIEAERRARAKVDRQPAEDGSSTPEDGAQAGDKPNEKALQTREDIARAARISANQVGLIEKIRKQATPEVEAAVKSGDISINAAAVVASLPEQEQKAAAQAGVEELKQVVKRVRESRRKPPKEAVNEADTTSGADDTAEITALRQRIVELEAENASLREEVKMLSAQLVG